MNKPVKLLYSAAQVRELDRIAIEECGIAGLTLMKRAAEACVEEIVLSWPEQKAAAVLCGSGNNAGDGFIIAGLLQARGWQVNISLIGREPSPDSDAGQALQFASDNGVPFVSIDEAIEGAGVIVDALLGTGAAGEVRPHYADAIESINQSGARVLSVDLPSGLVADTGAILGTCVRADVTVTFIGRKLGLLTADGPEYCGEVQFADLAVPNSVFEKVPAAARCLDYDNAVRALSPRHKNAHKRNHGQVLIVGGADGMSGAAIMAAEAALYTGAGLVSVATQNAAAMVARRPEVMAKNVTDAEELSTLLDSASVIVIGPGLGMNSWGRTMFAASLAADKPMVVDADGLNLLAENPTRADWVLTPHPGEASRLLTETSVQLDRPGAVAALTEKYGGTVLLKGAGTLIRHDEATSLCPYGNPGMSVGGMGDVLAGTIGGLMAQGLTSVAATELGAVVHSLAADYLVDRQGERGLLATELLPEIRRLLNP